MRKLLAIILLYTCSILPASQQQTYNYQNNIINLSEDNVVALKMKNYKTTLIGYDYLKKNHNIITENIPNGSPLDLNGLVRISDYFGSREDPITGKRRYHYGIDFSGYKGTDIYSTADGVVEKVSYSIGYGKHIVINHGNGIKTKYAHLNKYNVRKGQIVLKGECIGELGNTGRSTGPHLHYEVVINNVKIDPLKFYTDKNTVDDSLITILTNQKITDEWKLS